METDTVEGVHGPQVDVVAEGAAAQGPQLFQQKRRGNDGRAGIEGETVLVVDIRASAGRVELFEYLHRVAAHAQANGCGQSAKTAADDDR